MTRHAIPGLLVLALLTVNFGATSLTVNADETSVLWSIGVADDTPSEFALAPDGYERFVSSDFGWRDRHFQIGRSTPDEDWPYVLPGVADAWAGSGGLAGHRTQVLGVLFELEELPPEGRFRLVVDVVDAHPSNPPLLRVRVNEQSRQQRLKRGVSATPVPGAPAASREQLVAFEFGADALRRGGNHLALTSIEGSWLLFDQVRLEGPEGAKLAPARNTVVRGVRPDSHEMIVGGDRYQALLVDVHQIEGSAELLVRLDDEPILRHQLEPGRAILEAPMPAVTRPRKSRYDIVVGGLPRTDGSVLRSPCDLVTPADYVNPLLGTAHSRWMIAPGPWMPFGMVKLSPDNQDGGWQAGYDPHIQNVAGFSHIHEWTMAGLLFMPVTGPLETRVGDQYHPDGGYRSRIDPDREAAGTGFYRTFLSDHGIEVGLTATTRASLQRYTFPAHKDARVLIDLHFPAEYSFDVLECALRRAGDRRIEGRSVQRSPGVWGRSIAQDYTVCFVIEFDRPFRSLGAWAGDEVTRDVSVFERKEESDVGCFAEFDTTEETRLRIRTGISLVSVEQAALNLETEISRPFGFDFEAVVAHQREVWNDLLGRIQIETPDRREKVRFTTNLYRAFCARNTWSDVDGTWVDHDERVHKLDNPDSLMLGCDAFWNTFWNLNQVWNLVAPEWSSRWVRSQLAMYETGGWLAKGPAGLEYIPVMVAEHEIPLIVGAYQMGIRDFDAQTALEAVVKMQTTPAHPVGGGLAGNLDLETYLEHRYVPSDRGRASNTLEYAFDDWCVSQLARALGKTDTLERFLERSRWWRNIFDAETGYARLRRADGSWVEPFDPFRSGGNKQYVEGNAWQLTFFVPQDLPGLIEALGRNRFLRRLETGFAASEPTRFNAPNELYWNYPVVHGNQQSMHFAFLFNWADAPWLTQRWSRSVLERYYGHGPGDAYLGDEDQGQMSAWFVMAALGLFQMDGGCRVEPIYEIGSPRYPRAVIRLGERHGRGQTFTIEAHHASRKNCYVQSATLNGKPLDRWWFSASDLLRGGTLELEMGPEPNRLWGVSRAAGAVETTDGRVRVACVGDSITQGARVDAATESYPAVLSDLLGDGYAVRNFGVSGTTLIREGQPSVWNVLDDVLAFEPQVVVIALGTNDTVSGRRKNWERTGAFEENYRDLIGRLAALRTGPRILVCTPTAMVLEGGDLTGSRRASLEERRPRLEELCDRIRELVRSYHESGRHEFNVGLVELHRVVEGKPELITAGDGVHPSAAGHRAIAEALLRPVRDAIQRPGTGYILRGSRRTREEIEATYAVMPPVVHVPPANRFERLPKTAQALLQGTKLRVVMLGDSIVNDTSRSGWDLLVEASVPGARISKVTSVRGSTGCAHYRESERLQTYVLDHDPDLVMIGGISQGRDVGPIRDVVRKMREAGCEADVLLMTGPFGRRDPTSPDWSPGADANGQGYPERLERLAGEIGAGYLDLHGAWGRYVRDSGRPVDWFKRDAVHANERGEQILARILAAFFTPGSRE